jgi:hypothetical protein
MLFVATYLQHMAIAHRCRNTELTMSKSCSHYTQQKDTPQKQPPTCIYIMLPYTSVTQKPLTHLADTMAFRIRTLCKAGTQADAPGQMYTHEHEYVHMNRYTCMCECMKNYRPRHISLSIQLLSWRGWYIIVNQ